MINVPLLPADVREAITVPIDSLSQTTDAAGAVISESTYCPFGEVRTQTGTNPSPWGFVGSLGYYRDIAARLYVRARFYRTRDSRWNTVDPLWPEEPAFGYAAADPIKRVDPSGLVPVACVAACAGAAVCIIDLIAACSDWTGFGSFEECAWETFKHLPPWLQALCGAGLGGCLLCVGRQLIKPGPKPTPNPGPIPPLPVGRPVPGGPIPLPAPRPVPAPRPGGPGGGRCGPRPGTPRPSDRRFPPGRRYRNCKSAYLGCNNLRGGGFDFKTSCLYCL